MHGSSFLPLLWSFSLSIGMLVERQDLHLRGRDSWGRVGSGVMPSGRISSRILADK